MSERSSKPPLVASEQVRTLLTLVPFLLERGEVTLADAAREFDVTQAQLRTMIERLTLVGLPGSDGYYQMPHEMFDIDWELLDERDTIVIRERVALERAPKLSAREAAALLAGLQVAKSIPGIAENEVVQALSQKLARGTAGAVAEVVVAGDDDSSDVRREIARAVSERKTVVFVYHAPDRTPLERTVDPETLSVTDGQWYLQGWDHLRLARRTFHLDRIASLRVTELDATHAQETPAADVDAEAETEAVETDVTVRFAAEHAAALGDYLRDAPQHTTDGVTTATLRVGDPATLKRLAARGGGHIEIVAPASARGAALAWACEAIDLYRAAESSEPRAPSAGARHRIAAPPPRSAEDR